MNPISARFQSDILSAKAETLAGEGPGRISKKGVERALDHAGVGRERLPMDAAAAIVGYLTSDDFTQHATTGALKVASTAVGQVLQSVDVPRPAAQPVSTRATVVVRYTRGH